MIFQIKKRPMPISKSNIIKKGRREGKVYRPKIIPPVNTATINKIGFFIGTSFALKRKSKLMIRELKRRL